MLEADAQQGRRKRRLPKGTSQYQAAWITEDIEGEGGSSEEDEEEPADQEELDEVRCVLAHLFSRAIKQTSPMSLSSCIWTM